MDLSDLGNWRPLLTALVLPPVPLLLLVLVGWRLSARWRGTGFLVVLLSLAGIWLSACEGSALLLQSFVLRPPPALSRDAIDGYAQTMRTRSETPSAAIVVLGAGRERYAAEYGRPSLKPPSLERLRYGVWLGRHAGLPVLFSGGVGWEQNGGDTEADVAGAVAREEFGVPLKWLEKDSRDTHENAVDSIRILEAAGIRQIVLVTHAWHMPRALFEFRNAAAGRIDIVPAPLGRIAPADRNVFDWLPSHQGYEHVRVSLRELLGLVVARLTESNPTK